MSAEYAYPFAPLLPRSVLANLLAARDIDVGVEFTLGI